MTAGSVSAPLIIPIIDLQRHRTKNHIDTSTPVSLHSETPGVQIFFSLDGSRPVVVVAQRGSSGSSRKYSKPILLPAGRVAVRALAVSSDGRQSSVVTKVFSVDLVDSEDRKWSKEDFLRSDQQPQFEPSENSSLLPAEPTIVGSASPPPAPRLLAGRLGGAACRRRQGGSGVSEQLSSTLTSQCVHREMDILRCPQCLSVRPSDPSSGFCPECGAALPVLPEQRPPPAEGGQVLCCVICHSLVPVNTHTCLICEASIQPQSSLQERVVCVCCGGVNPAHVCSCLICESRLQGNSAPSVLPAGSRTLTCSRCKRLNRGDARFCDWCGSKPRQAASCVVCWRCGANGNLYGSYCAACGALLEAPPPPTSCSDITGPTATNQVCRSADITATWQAMPSSGSAPRTKLATPTAEQGTQTVGLYYPSATGLQRKYQQSATRDRQPLLTAISPGRGFWRLQLDHVCAHLRSYAQNNASFRALLGEPRLGRMVSAVIQEDRYEVSVTVSFVSAGREQQGGPAGGATAAMGGATAATGATGATGAVETLSSVTERSEDCSRNDRSNNKRLKQKPTPKPPLAAWLQVWEVRLLAELGPGPGRGQAGVVQQFLDQGVDPSCCDADGRHALAVAAVNGHHDVLPVLVQRGADVDQQSGPLRNSALHEVAALGAEGLQSAQVLLSLQASVQRRNASGRTPYDVAVTSGCNDMVTLLAARAGLHLLGKLGKPKVNLDVY
ncbi:double zinc ribbon and ankyrin repeat-containing protein 1 [Centropristis striata]|uniref:double zinc ribbon and ankyrin repeat-containing protein 1 n=1 Tax=Centropristis striata TaxID=184440 RepID=UPI0027DF3B86|nr:double zinc ribbon and ankyrin repeat-containing protein 1 [Centropristis striata]